MQLTDIQKEWLKEERNHRVILADIHYYEDNILRVATSPYIDEWNNAYEETILDSIVLTQSIMDTKRVSSLKLLNYTNSSGIGVYDDLITQPIEGHQIVLYLGDLSWDRKDFIILYIGKITSIGYSDTNSITIDIGSAVEVLDNFIQFEDWHFFRESDLANTTVSTDIVGTVRPISFGYCFNIPMIYLGEVQLASVIPSWDPTDTSYGEKYFVSNSAYVEVTQLRESGNILVEHVNRDPTDKDFFVENNGTNNCTYVYLLRRSTGLITGDIIANTYVNYPHEVFDFAQFILGPYYTHETTGGHFLKNFKNATEFRDKCQYKVGVYFNEKATFREVFDRLLSNLGIYINLEYTNANVDINGNVSQIDREFFYYRLDAPEYEPSDVVYYFEQDDLLEDGLSLITVEHPIYKYTIGYDKNYTVQNRGDLAASITDSQEDIVMRYGQEYRYEIGTVGTPTEIETFKQKYPLTKDANHDTYITLAAQALEEAYRRIGLRQEKRYIYQLEIYNLSPDIKIGDKINLKYPRYGFDLGKDVIIISIETDYIDKKSTLEVYL